MSLRPPKILAPRRPETGVDVLAVEILAEKAAALGRSGEAVEKALAALAQSTDAEQRPALVKAAAVAVHAFFIQRELMGFRRHQEVVERYGIPKEVLARVGAQ